MSKKFVKQFKPIYYQNNLKLIKIRQPEHTFICITAKTLRNNNGLGMGTVFKEKYPFIKGAEI